MREVIPSEVLWRLLNATPEQFAAVERILGVKGNGGSEAANLQHVEDDRPGRVSEDVARSAFALLEKLELDAPLKAPSVLTVFRLYCVDGLSADRVARKCRCAKGTVMSRLRFIEEVTNTRAVEFRAMSGHLQRVDDELRHSGAREVYRRGLAQGQE